MDDLSYIEANKRLYNPTIKPIYVSLRFKLRAGPVVLMTPLPFILSPFEPISSLDHPLGCRTCLCKHIQFP